MSVVSNKDGNAESDSYETLCFSAKILALDNVRLTIVTFEIPEPKRFKSDNSPISPAPITTACLLFNFPNTFLANSTAA